MTKKLGILGYAMVSGLLIFGLTSLGCDETGLLAPEDAGQEEHKKTEPGQDVLEGELVWLEDSSTPVVKLKLHSVSPNSGPLDGGTLVALKGVGFLMGARVYFGEEEASNVQVETQFLITCTAPPTTTAGKVEVRVTVPDGRSDGMDAAFNYYAQEDQELSVTSILPEAGPETGGFLCILNGAGFQPGISVRLGPAAAEAVTVVSPTSLHFVAPAGLPGTVNVVVRIGEKQAVLPEGFEYLPAHEKDPLTVASISPANGPVSGGILALVKGTGFADGIAVGFGTEAADVLDVSSSNTMTVQVPAGLPGEVDLTLTLDDEVAILYDAFEYVDEGQAKLSVESIQPGSGPVSGGFLCAISGSGFVAGIQVFLGDQAVQFVNVLADDVLTFVAPPGTPGPVDVMVKLGEEEAVLSEGLVYLEDASLALLSVEPASGPAAGGTLCLLKGAGFSPETTAYFGGKPAPVLEVPSELFMAVSTPPADGPGEVDVTVANSDGSNATLEQGFTYVVEETLLVSGLQPGSGDVAGGYLVMLTGSGFKPGMTASLCDEAAPGVQVLSSQAAVVTVPPGVPGACDVEVKNPDGESYLLGACCE